VANPCLAITLVAVSLSSRARDYQRQNEQHKHWPGGKLRTHGALLINESRTLCKLSIQSLGIELYQFIADEDISA
jgi:hypothetical protein